MMTRIDLDGEGIQSEKDRSSFGSSRVGYSTRATATTDPKKQNMRSALLKILVALMLAFSCVTCAFVWKNGLIDVSPQKESNNAPLLSTTSDFNQTSSSEILSRISLLEELAKNLKFANEGFESKYRKFANSKPATEFQYFKIQLLVD
jgi:hypothetical protein